jgi:hypothetical protein
MTIELKLDKEDAECLEQVLEAYLSELRFEIADTDSFDYRSRLHKQEDRIKGMIGTLTGASEPGLRASAE